VTCPLRSTGITPLPRYYEAVSPLAYALVLSASRGFRLCNWRPEHLFTLGQSRDLYRIYQQQIVNCNLEIEKMLRDFEPRADPVEKPLPPDRKQNRAGSKRRKKNGHPHPEFDLRTRRRRGDPSPYADCIPIISQTSGSDWPRP
jgi:hypothetical protein